MNKSILAKNNHILQFDGDGAATEYGFYKPEFRPHDEAPQLLLKPAKSGGSK